MLALKDFLELTGCADELASQPASWEQLMTAVASGAIDFDSVAEVTMACTDLAGAEWEQKVTEALFASDGDIDSPAGRILIECGMAADAAC